MGVHLAVFEIGPYLEFNGGKPIRREPQNPEMIDRYHLTLIRVSGPRDFALMGEVRPGAWIFGVSAGGRAP
jgi:hypothetical protein